MRKNNESRRMIKGMRQNETLLSRRSYPKFQVRRFTSLQGMVFAEATSHIILVQDFLLSFHNSEFCQQQKTYIQN